MRADECPGCVGRHDRREPPRGLLLAGAVVLAFTVASTPATAGDKVRDLIKATTVRSSWLAYYGPADPEPVRQCLQLSAEPATLMSAQYRTCRSASYAAGKALPLWYAEVSVSAERPNADEEVRDVVLLAAAKIAADGGHRFLTKVAAHEIVTCSGVPTSSTSATLSGNSIYGTTTFSTYRTCSLLYTVRYLMFDDYEVIRPGVLNYVKDGRGVLDPDLYYDVVEHIANTRNADRTQLDQFGGHPLEAWKSYLPAKEVYASAMAKYGLREPIKFGTAKPETQPAHEATIEGRLRIKAEPP